jgi:hypothetical protein
MRLTRQQYPLNPKPRHRPRPDERGFTIPGGAMIDLAYRILCIVFIFLGIIIELAALGILGLNLNPL